MRPSLESEKQIKLARKVARRALASHRVREDTLLCRNEMGKPDWVNTETGKPAPLTARNARMAFEGILKADNPLRMTILPLMIPSSHSAKIDGTWFQSDTTRQVPMNTRGLIIGVMGNSAPYEVRLNEVKREVERLGVDYMLFNYRGVSRSQGEVIVFSDLVDDCEAVVKNALKLGYDPENIVISGHSMGGAVSTYCADRFHRRGQYVRLFNARSFARIADVPATRFWLRWGKLDLPQHGWRGIFDFSALGKLYYKLTHKYFKKKLKSLGWDVDAGYIFQALRSDCKEFLTAYPEPEPRHLFERLRVRKTRQRGDLTLHYITSIDYALRSTRLHAMTLMNLSIDLLSHQTMMLNTDRDKALQLFGKLYLKIRYAKAGSCYFVHQALASLSEETKSIQLALAQAIDQANMQNISEVSEALRRLVRKICRILDEDLTAHRMRNASDVPPWVDGHEIPVSKLQSYTKPHLSGQDYFYAFVRARIPTLSQEKA